MSEAIILNTARTEARCEWMDDGMRQFVWSGQCRRVVLGRFMDGMDCGTYEDGEQKCDICGGADDMEEPGHNDVDDIVCVGRIANE